MMELGGAYVYTGEMLTAASGTTPNALLDDFNTLNLNASWYSILGGGFDLNLYVTNVTDQECISFSSGTYTQLSYESVNMGLPRMYGASLRYSF